jgi:hypothetical protein
VAAKKKATDTACKRSHEIARRSRPAPQARSCQRGHSRQNVTICRRAGAGSHKCLYVYQPVRPSLRTHYEPWLAISVVIAAVLFVLILSLRPKPSTECHHLSSVKAQPASSSPPPGRPSFLMQHHVKSRVPTHPKWPRLAAVNILIWYEYRYEKYEIQSRRAGPG